MAPTGEGKYLSVYVRSLSDRCEDRQPNVLCRISFSLSLVKVSVFSLSLVTVRERAPESHLAGSVCHLRRRRLWCAVKRLLHFAARCALAIRLSGLVLIGWRLALKEPPISHLSRGARILILPSRKQYSQ